MALCAPDLRRPHRSNHCRRQNLELGVCINLSIPLMHLTPNPCCQTEMGQLPHRARSITATNSDVEIFLDDFVAPVRAALGAPDSRQRSLRLKYGRRTVRPAPWTGGREPPSPRRWSKARSGGSAARLIADGMILNWESARGALDPGSGSWIGCHAPCEFVASSNATTADAKYDVEVFPWQLRGGDPRGALHA